MDLRKTPIVLAIIISVAAAQIVSAGAQARLEGSVTDAAGSPIVGASITITTIEITSYKKVLTSNKRGEFKTLILDATRRYKFLIEADGYQPQEAPFKLAAGSSDNEFPFILVSIDEAVAQGRVDQLEQPGYKEFDEGRRLYAAGDKEGARLKFAEAVAAKPDLLAAVKGLADLSYEAGLYDEAMEAVGKCLDLNEKDSDCLAIGANASQALGDNEAHAKFMALYQEANPNDPTILYNRAATALNSFDDEGAKPLLEQCLEADPEFPQCNFEYGMLLLRTGDMEGAKKHLEKYLEPLPDGPDATTAMETIKYL